MDKNMINIDDLFKQRLSGGEEEERPGAWLNMRKLLDEQMPEKPLPTGSTFNWRRMMGVLAGLVALSAVSVGGYQMATSFRKDKATNGAVASTVNMPSTHTERLARIAANSEQAFAGRNIASASNSVSAIDPAKATAPSNSNTGKSAISGIQRNSGVINVASATGKASEVNKTESNATAIHSDLAGAQTRQASAGSTSSNTSDVPMETTSEENTLASNTTTKPAASDHKNVKIVKINKLDKANTIFASNAASVKMPNAAVSSTDMPDAKTASAPVGSSDENISAANKVNTYAATASGNKSTAVVHATKTDMKTVANKHAGNNNKKDGAVAKNNTNKGSNGGDKKPVAGTAATAKTKTGTTANSVAKTGNTKKDGSEGKYVVTKEPVAKIETKQTYTKDGLKVDTISMGMAEIEKLTLASNNNNTPAEKPLVNPAASGADNTMVVSAENTEVNTAKEGEMVPLSKFRVARSKQPLWDPRKFEEMVSNAKMGMSGIRFYPGIVAGVNTLLGGKNTMAGFQLGVSGALNLNERWGIFSEIKYVHRFNSGSTIDVNFNEESTSIVNGTTTWTVTPVSRKFSFPSISSLEIPIALRHTYNRINLFLGANIAYYFAMNPTFFDAKGATVTQTTKPATDEGIGLKTTDFGSRYGVGYMLGAGYHLTPAVHLDLRLAQPVWDNTNSKASRYVSEKVFRVPTIQVNFNYRFSSQRRIK